MLRRTKSAVIYSLENVLRLKKAYSSIAKEATSMRKKPNHSELIARLFLTLEELVVLCDREAAVEPSPTNTVAFTGLFENSALPRLFEAACQALQSFFDEVITRLSVQPDWAKIALDMGFLEHSFTLSKRIISPERTSLDKARRDLREHAEEQQKMRTRARRLSDLIDIDADLIEEEKEMSLEEAILVIQKLERIYQAISRYNYLKHVYQRAMDIREGGTTMTAEQAIIRIQARTRGYFARKRVREMRQRELDLLGMTTSSLLSSMKLSDDVPTVLPRIEKGNIALELLLEQLKDNFFPQAVPDDVPVKPLQRIAETEDLYHELCLRRIIRDVQRQKLSMEEIVSERAMVTVENRSFELDIRLFLDCSFVIPLALRGWRIPSSKRWILLTGSDGAGKSAWAEAAAASSGAVILRVSPAILSKGRRRTVKSIVKFVKLDPNTVITIDRLEVFKLKSKMTSASLNLMRMLLIDLSTTNAFVIGMSRTAEIHPIIRSLFNYSVQLEALREHNKVELIGRFLSRTQDIGRLPKIPDKISHIRRQTKTLNSGKTGKSVRSQWSRISGNN